MEHNIIILKENQHATYLVRESFDYYVQLSPNSSITLKPYTAGRRYNITKNIWGPGNIHISDANVSANLGSPPDISLISKGCWQYNGSNTFTEII